MFDSHLKYLSVSFNQVHSQKKSIIQAQQIPWIFNKEKLVLRQFAGASPSTWNNQPDLFKNE